jgi:two-component system response regulator FixJ
MQMPGMGGLELQKALRALGLQLPIIFITAFPDRRIRERAEAAGAVAFLEKPFEAQLIVKSLELAFARRDRAEFAPPQT